jgi:hypothetical protein
MKATGIRVPNAVVEALGKGRKPPVSVTFNGFTYRTTVAVMDGEFWIPVSADIRKQANVAAGDAFDVEIELDLEPRTVELPEDLLLELNANPAATAAWEKLAPSAKKAIVTNIEGTNNPKTRARRVAKAMEQLGG